MWLIVVFLETKLTDIVPLEWMEFEDGKSGSTYWPSKGSNITKSVKAKEHYSPDWGKVTCREIYRNDNYDKVRAKLNLAEYTSDLATETDIIPENKMRSQRNKRKRIVYTPDSSTSEEDVPKRKKQNNKIPDSELQLPTPPTAFAAHKYNAMSTPTPENFPYFQNSSDVNCTPDQICSPDVIRSPNVKRVSRKLLMPSNCIYKPNQGMESTNRNCSEDNQSLNTSPSKHRSSQPLSQNVNSRQASHSPNSSTLNRKSASGNNRRSTTSPKSSSHKRPSTQPVSANVNKANHPTHSSVLKHKYVSANGINQRAITSPRSSPRKRLSSQPLSPNVNSRQTSQSPNSSVLNRKYVSANGINQRAITSPRSSPRKRLSSQPLSPNVNSRQASHSPNSSILNRQFVSTNVNHHQASLSPNTSIHRRGSNQLNDELEEIDGITAQEQHVPSCNSCKGFQRLALSYLEKSHRQQQHIVALLHQCVDRKRKHRGPALPADMPFKVPICTVDDMTTLDGYLESQDMKDIFIQFWKIHCLWKLSLLRLCTV